MGIPNASGFDDLEIFDLSDESPEQFPAGQPWMAATADNYAVFLASEEEAAALQRHWRQLHGRDALTGGASRDAHPATMNPVDLLDCGSGHHDYSDDPETCGVCGQRSRSDRPRSANASIAPTDLDTPEGRAAAAEALGPDGYNKAMMDHLAAATVDIVNGYRLRFVSSRFGRLCQVVGTDMAFSSLEAASAHARALPYHDDPELSFAFAGFSERERDAILTGLRLLADTRKSGPMAVAPNDGDLGDILTNSGKHPSLTADEIHDLCDGLLSGDFDSA